ncbi:MAG: HAMP domain-containing sensor histidine kinase [Minisyncoccia bacterium]
MSDRYSHLLLRILIIGTFLSIGALFFKYVAAPNYLVYISEESAVSAREAAPLIKADSLACEWDSAPLLFVSDNVFSPLIYYSHVFPMVACAILAFLIWRQQTKELLNKLFLILASAFITWCLFDLILWADANPDFIMFFWSAEIYLDLLIYLSAAYLLYVFIRRQDLPLVPKIIGTAAILPVLFLAPTALNLTAFDYTNCDREALEGVLWYYVYFVEVLVVLGMSIFGMREFFATKDQNKKIQVSLLSTGLVLFLLAFSWGNIVGSLSEDWAVAQYGLFGMPVFLGIITYLIVQFQAFRVRVIATTALVISLWVLLFSVLLLETIESAKPIIMMTLVFFALMGFFLIKSVQREIRQRQVIELQATQLDIINRQQEALLAFISHEVKGYLAKSQAAFAGILQGDYGEAPAPLLKMADTGLIDMRRGVDMVTDILEASNLRKGTVSYEKKPFDLRASVEQIVHDLASMAEKKNLSLALSIADGNYTLTGDEAKIRRHVLRNLIENSIRYTLKGSIQVSLSRDARAVHFSVKDTGVGITKEDMQHLFTEGGHGKDSLKVNTDSTGYGLFIAKQITEVHGGTIKAFSEGKGTGSEFLVEIPLS